MRRSSQDLCGFIWCCIFPENPFSAVPPPSASTSSLSSSCFVPFSLHSYFLIPYYPLPLRLLFPPFLRSVVPPSFTHSLTHLLNNHLPKWHSMGKGEVAGSLSLSSVITVMETPNPWTSAETQSRSLQWNTNLYRLSETATHLNCIFTAQHIGARHTSHLHRALNGEWTLYHMWCRFRFVCVARACLFACACLPAFIPPCRCVCFVRMFLFACLRSVKSPVCGVQCAECVLSSV